MSVLEFSTSLAEAEVDGEVPLLLLDSRSDVLGARLAFDTAMFEDIRKSLKVPPEMKFHVFLRAADVTKESDINNGSFLPIKGSKYNTWKLTIPVKDYFSIDPEALKAFNRTLYMTIRYSVHFRTLTYMFQNVKMAREAGAKMSSTLYTDAKNNACELVDNGQQVLVPSTQGTFLGEAEFEIFDLP